MESGLPANCMNGALVEVVNQLSRWAGFTESSGHVSRPGTTSASSGSTSFYGSRGYGRDAVSSRLGTATEGSRDLVGRALGLSLPFSASTNFGMGTPLASGSPMFVSSPVPKPLKEVSTGIVLFEGQDPVEGLQLQEVRATVCIQ